MDRTTQNQGQYGVPISTVNTFLHQESLTIPIDNKEAIKQIAYVNEQGSNALMLALRNHQKAVRPMLQVINTTSTDMNYYKESILTQVDSSGYNPLMLAVIYQPEIVQEILASMKDLTAQQLSGIYTQADNSSRTALHLALGNNQNAATSILEAIALSNINIDVKYGQLKSGLSKMPRRFTPSPAILEAFWEKELLDLLEQLKPTEDTQFSAAEDQQKTLYLKLKDDCDKFLISPRKHKDIMKFHHSWNHEIDEFRKEHASAGSAQFKHVLTLMLLVLSVVGIIYIAYQAGKNYAKNRSLFFPSALEEQINKIQDKANLAVSKEGEAQPSDKEIEHEKSSIAPA